MGKSATRKEKTKTLLSEMTVVKKEGPLWYDKSIENNKVGAGRLSASRHLAGKQRRCCSLA